MLSPSSGNDKAPQIYSAYAQHTRNNLRRATKLFASTVIGQETVGHVLKLEKKGGGRVGLGQVLPDS
jgi:hypothetical protein